MAANMSQASGVVAVAPCLRRVKYEAPLSDWRTVSTEIRAHGEIVAGACLTMAKTLRYPDRKTMSDASRIVIRVPERDPLFLA